MFSPISGAHAREILKAHLALDIVRVELIHTHERADRQPAQDPLGRRPEHGELARVDIVRQALVKLPPKPSSVSMCTPVSCRLTPMCECTTRLTPSTPSRTGYAVPLVAKAAAVSGTSDAESRRSKAQWCEPCVREGFGKGTASLTVPRGIAISQV